MNVMILPFLIFLTTVSLISAASPSGKCHYPVSVCGSANLNAADRALLLSIKDSFSIGLGYDWDPSLSCGQGWTGVCTDSVGKVTELYLSGAFRNTYYYYRDPFPIPEELGGFSNLLYLDLSRNAFSDIPSSFGLLSELQYLNLEYNNINTFFGDRGFSYIGSLSKLTFLSVEANSQNETIYGAITKLTNLETLVLSLNYLYYLPSNIGVLSKLRNLTIYGTAISYVPPSLANASSLSFLFLKSNNLNETSLPTIAKLKKLTYLDLSQNQFTSIPSCSLDSLKNLIYLSFQWSTPLRDTAIPNFEGLRSLEVLDLSRCGLRGNIPSSYRKLKNLKTLLLNDNRLCGGIPSYFGNLPFLTTLDLSNNFLTGSVPPNLQSKFCSAFGSNCLVSSGACSFTSREDYSCTNGCDPVPGIIDDLTQKWYSYASLSSTYENEEGSLAIDGYAGGGDLSRHTCAHSGMQTDPSLYIDLHRLPVVVGTVQLYNRLDSFSERLNGVQVYVGTSYSAYNAPENKICVDPKFTFGPNNKGFPLNVTCNLPGNLVWVVVPGENKFLTVCEVVVFGTWESY